MEYYYTVKKNKIMKYSGKWVELRPRKTNISWSLLQVDASFESLDMCVSIGKLIETQESSKQDEASWEGR